MVAEIPSADMRLHLCLRAGDWLLLIDTCPSREVFEAFAASPQFRELLQRHGLPDPARLEGFPSMPPL